MLKSIKKNNIIRTFDVLEVEFVCEVCGIENQTMFWADEISAGIAETECPKCEQGYYLDVGELKK